MTVFDPPIEKRETEELIEIGNGTTDYWAQEAIDKAKAELIKRNISREEQDKVLNRWAEEERKRELGYQQQLILNESESYSKIRMIVIFLIAPLIVFRGFFFDIRLSVLKSENYKTKFQQRLAMLILGNLFYIALFIVGYYFVQAQWQKEVDRTDIYKWERNHINDSTKQIKSNLNDSLKK
jgi:hypothetical protein